MSLINKMNVGNTDYDIQDRLMPDAIGQAGQVLKVKDDGSGLEFSTIESGGGKYYKHYSILSYTSGAVQLSIYAYTISNVPNNYTNFEDIVNNFISGFWKDPSTLYPITKLASAGSDIAVSYLNTSSGRELSATNVYIIYSDTVTEL